MRNLFVDSDGVMVDMDEYVKRMLSVKAQTDRSAFWNELSVQRQPYRRMKPTPYARQLWLGLLLLAERYGTARPKILTALPLKSSMPSAEADKRWWYAHQPKIFDDAPPEVLVGPYSQDKVNHCSPGDVLIDDTHRNCEAWAAAGGIAIHHTGDWQATLRALKKVLEP